MSTDETTEPSIAAVTFHVTDPATGLGVLIEADDEIPAEYLDQVGDHAIVGGRPERAEERVPDPDGDDDKPEVFDPRAEGVTAKQVHDYLSGIDVDAEGGQAEYDRVVAAEKAGQNRSTAIPS